MTILKFLFLFTSMPLFAVSSQTLDLEKAKSEVGFLAIGKPSALRIKGNAKSEKPLLRGRLYVADGMLTGTAVFDLNQLETGISLRDQHMKEKYLEVEKHPMAELKLTKMRLLTEGVSEEEPFEGSLKLHGRESPVKGTANSKRDGDSFTATFQFKVKVSDFGIEVPKYLGVTMADEVTVDVKTEGRLSQ